MAPNETLCPFTKLVFHLVFAFDFFAFLTGKAFAYVKTSLLFLVILRTIKSFQ